MNTKNIPFIVLILSFLLLAFLKYYIPFPVNAYTNANLPYTKQNPVKIQNLNNIKQPKFLSIDLDFVVTAIQRNHVLQIGNRSDLGVEILPDGLLCLHYGPQQTLIIIDKVQTNHPYHLSLRTDFKDYLKIICDQTTHHLLPEQIKQVSYDFSRFYVHPDVQDFKISLIYIQTSIIHQVIQVLMCLNLFVLGFYTIWRLKPYWPNKSTFQKENLIEIATITGWGLLWAGIASLGVYLKYFSIRVPYSLFFISNLIFLFVPSKSRKSLTSFLNKFSWLWCLSAAIFLIFALFLIVNAINLKETFFSIITAEAFTLFVGFMALFIAIIFIFQTKSASKGSKKHMHFYIFADVSILCLFLWLSFGFSVEHSNQIFSLQKLQLFIVSTVWYLLAIKYVKYQIFNRLIACLMIIAGLFFNDYEWLSTSLTSNAPLTFFWCYLLLAYFLWRPQYTSGYAYLGIALWIVACFWSLESALLATFIYFSGVSAQFYYDLKLKSDNTLLLSLRYWGKPWILLGAALLMVNLFYKLAFNHWLSFHPGMVSSENATTVYYQWHINLICLIFLFIGLMYTYLGLARPRKTIFQIPIAATFGGVWGMAMYVMINPNLEPIQALAPLIGFMIYFAILIIKERTLGFYKIILQLTALPFLFILLMHLSTF